MHVLCDRFFFFCILVFIIEKCGSYLLIGNCLIEHFGLHVDSPYSGGLLFT